MKSMSIICSSRFGSKLICSIKYFIKKKLSALLEVNEKMFLANICTISHHIYSYNCKGENLPKHG